MRGRERLLDALLLYGIPTLVMLAVLVLVALVIQDCTEKSDCRRKGGEIEEYNQHTVLVPISCGSGCTIMVPEEVSDWRCIDAESGKLVGSGRPM